MKIMIVDDHPLARMGISSIFHNQKNCQHIIESSNISEALAVLSKENIDIGLVDLRLHNEDGLELIYKAKEMKYRTKFIILTSFISQQDFKLAEELNVYGYILKEAFPEDIIYAVDLIKRGKKYYDSEIIKNIDENNEHNLLNKLTKREQEVLIELSTGLSNIEISEKLFISEYTTKKHVSSILSKLNLKNRSQLVYLMNNKIKGGEVC